MLFLYHHPSLPTPIAPLKKFGQSCEYEEGRPGVLFPQVSIVCQGESLPHLCGTQVCLLRPCLSSPSCLLPPLHIV